VGLSGLAPIVKSRQRDFGQTPDAVEGCVRLLLSAPRVGELSAQITLKGRTFGLVSPPMPRGPTLARAERRPTRGS